MAKKSQTKFENVIVPPTTKFKVECVNVAGHQEAMFGLGLSHGLTSGVEHIDDMSEELIQRIEQVAKKLLPLGKGHNKFSKQIQIWFDITASRAWWVEMDTYGVGVSQQSESSMHTLTSTEITQDNFSRNVLPEIIDHLNKNKHDLLEMKANLPEAFLQRRIVTMSLMALRNIITQRANHRLPEWRYFVEYCISNDILGDYLTDLIPEISKPPVNSPLNEKV